VTKKVSKFLVKLNFLKRTDMFDQVMGKRYSHFQSAQSSFVAFPASCLWYRGVYLEMRQGVKPVTHLPPLQRLRMLVAIFTLLQCAFMT
jgi:hypothetical protein